MNKTKNLFALACLLVALGPNSAIAASPPTEGLSMWLRADAGVILNGSAVAQWDDQSGLGNHAFQGTPANQPALVTSATGLPGVRFNGFNGFLNFTNDINNAAGLSIFIVANNNLAAQNGGASFSDAPAIFWNELASWGWVFLSPFQTNVNWRIGTTIANNNEQYARPSSVGVNFTLTSLVKNGSTETLYVNKTLARTATGKADNPFGVRSDGYLGRGQSTYFSGDVLEVLVYNVTLSDTDRQTVENYLYDKYLANQAPTVAITSPSNNAGFASPANITITADAIDDNSVTNVEFFVNGVSVGNDTTAPYSIAVNGLTGGAYALTAKAADNAGASTVSSTVLVHVNFATPQDGPNMDSLGLWYKADAGVITSGGKVTDWIDQSGNSRNAAQLLTNAQPAIVTGGNGKPAVAFNGLTNFMTFTMPLNGLNELSVVVVSSATSPQNPGDAGDNSAIVWWNETASWGGLNMAVYQDYAHWRFGTTQAQSSSPNYPGPAHTRPVSLQRNYARTAVVKGGTSETLYTNGAVALTVTGKLATLAGINGVGAYLGAGGNPMTFFRGEIQELLVYTRALTATDMTNLDAYLQAKYFNKAQPTVSITSPTNNTPLMGPVNITVTTTPADADGTVAQVDFFDSGVLVGTVTNAPWQYTVTNATTGAHTFVARAIDNEGLFNYSPPAMTFVKAASGWTLVENFENRQLGPILYQGDWAGLFPADQVAKDGTGIVGVNTNNNVLKCVRGNQTLSYPILIPQGTTSTIFFRAASTTWSREEIYLGASTGRGIGRAPIGDFEAQMTRFTGASLANKMIGVRDGGTYYNSCTNFASDVWYKLWMVINNATDTWKLYIQGGEYATPTQVFRGANASFTFRNGTSTKDLVRLVYWTSATTVSAGGFWMDDIYIASGENLTDASLPPPPSLTIVRAGDNVVVSWPASAGAVVLQSSPTLAPASWSDVLITPVLVGDQNTVTLPIGGLPEFFSLRQ